MEKRSRRNEMHKIQWKISLPEDIWNHIFLYYCDYDYIVTTRMLQSKYVEHCTQGNNFILAIRKSNLDNMKWIYQCGKVELKQVYSYRSSWIFTCAAEVGNLQVLDWLLVNDCPWEEKTFQGLDLKESVQEWLLNHSMITKELQ